MDRMPRERSWRDRIGTLENDLTEAVDRVRALESRMPAEGQQRINELESLTADLKRRLLEVEAGGGTPLHRADTALDRVAKLEREVIRDRRVARERYEELDERLGKLSRRLELRYGSANTRMAALEDLAAKKGSWVSAQRLRALEGRVKGLENKVRPSPEPGFNVDPEVRLKTENTAHLRKLLSRMYHALRNERTFSYREMKALQREMMEECHRIDDGITGSAGGGRTNNNRA